MVSRGGCGGQTPSGVERTALAALLPKVVWGFLPTTLARGFGGFGIIIPMIESVFGEVSVSRTARKTGKIRGVAY